MQTILGGFDYLLIAALIVIIGRVAGFARSDDSVARSNARKLDAIIKYMNIPAPPVSRPGLLTEAVQAAIDRGEKIHAIKLYRAETGAGLKEAKDAIDSYRPRPHA